MRRKCKADSREPARAPVRAPICTECHVEDVEIHLVEFRTRCSGVRMMGHMCLECMAHVEVTIDCGPLEW